MESSKRLQGPIWFTGRSTWIVWGTEIVIVIPESAGPKTRGAELLGEGEGIVGDGVPPDPPEPSGTGAPAEQPARAMAELARSPAGNPNLTRALWGSITEQGNAR
ncbi:MAG: hypothetical protein ACYDHB_08250 [Candidatus Dormibacteria bacterium]